MAMACHNILWSAGPTLCQLISRIIFLGLLVKLYGFYSCSTVNTIPIILSYRHRICEDPSQVARDNILHQTPSFSAP